MTRSRAAAVATALGVLLALLVGVGQPALAKGKHGGVEGSLTPSCSYSGRTLASITAPPQRVSITRSWYYSGHSFQWIAVQTVLQGEVSGKWRKVAARPAGKRSPRVLVTVRRNPAWKVAPSKKKQRSMLTYAGSVLSSNYSAFRVQTKLSWYDYDRHVVGSVTRTTSSCVRTLPAPPVVHKVVSIVAGDYHACALMDDHSLRCWGENTDGQIGDGTTTNATRPVTPIGMGSGVTSYALARQATCAVQSGVNRCWGDGRLIGDGVTTNRATPTQTSGLSGVQTVYGGGSSYEFCTRSTSVTMLQCWGAAGVGEKTGNVLTPYSLTSVTAPIVASGGSSFGCAAGTAKVWCWGGDSKLQMGASETSCGQQTSSATPCAPTVLASVTDAASLAAWANGACALVVGGAVKCWGDQEWGTLGNGVVSTAASAPVATKVLTSGVTSLSAANGSACAVKAGSVYCWGNNTAGQLGTGTTVGESTPTLVSGLSGITGVAVGMNSAYAWNAAGQVWAWGTNDAGELGDGTTTTHLSPVAISIH